MMGCTQRLLCVLRSTPYSDYAYPLFRLSVPLIPLLLCAAQYPGPPGPDGPDGAPGKPGEWGHSVRPAPKEAPRRFGYRDMAAEWSTASRCRLRLLAVDASCRGVRVDVDAF